jgi:NADPH:quinone reductase-like Zn-dependent oxidoreductase
MRRVRYHEYSGPEVLKAEEMAIPEPGAGEVLVRTEAIGANFVDTRLRQGGRSIFQRRLPCTVSDDVVGTVEELGSGDDAALRGARVAGLTEDAFADDVLLAAAWLAHVQPGQVVSVPNRRTEWSASSVQATQACVMRRSGTRVTCGRAGPWAALYCWRPARRSSNWWAGRRPTPRAVARSGRPAW